MRSTELLVRQVHGVPRPRLRVEVAAHRRFWISQDGDPVLVVEVDRSHYGFHYLRTGRYDPVLPPITAAETRRAPSWPHRYLAWLAQGPGPLHTGWWSLSSLAADGSGQWHPWSEVALDDPTGYCDWFDGFSGIVPLRRLPAPDDDRVRALRRQARAGQLPPLVVWWVSGLDAWVLLDGHARLAAARAEDQMPRMLSLAARPAADESGGGAEERRDQHEIPTRQIDAGTVDRPASAGRSRTRAWAMPRGKARWAAVVPADWPPPEEPAEAAHRPADPSAGSRASARSGAPSSP